MFFVIEKIQEEANFFLRSYKRCKKCRNAVNKPNTEIRRLMYSINYIGKNYLNCVWHNFSEFWVLIVFQLVLYFAFLTFFNRASMRISSLFFAIYIYFWVQALMCMHVLCLLHNFPTYSVIYINSIIYMFHW